ncbi:hypothetical protein [Streptomyces syringium]|uniref:hypothetical protein n=1 Tax=Streptomyces syringium TaxID=76729 RepID=UPI003F56C2C7
MVVKDTIKDADGTVHTRYERTYGGLPVLGGDLVVHRAADGAVKDVTKAVKVAIKVTSLTPRQTPTSAKSAAVKAAKAAKTSSAAIGGGGGGGPPAPPPPPGGARAPPPPPDRCRAGGRWWPRGAGRTTARCHDGRTCGDRDAPGRGGPAAAGGGRPHRLPVPTAPGPAGPGAGAGGGRPGGRP